MESKPSDLAVNSNSDFRAEFIRFLKFLDYPTSNILCNVKILIISVLYLMEGSVNNGILGFFAFILFVVAMIFFIAMWKNERKKNNQTNQ